MIEIKTNKPRNSSSYDPISICSLDIVNGSVRITSFTLYWTADDYHISLWSLNMWGIRWNEHGFCIVDFTAKWEKTDYYCWAQLQRLYLSHSSFVGFFFYIRALNIINERGCGHCCRLRLRNVKSIPGAFRVSQMKNTSRFDQCTSGLYDFRLVLLS